MTFLTDTRLSLNAKPLPTSGRHYEGLYTYQGQVLECPRFFVRNIPSGYGVHRTFQVLELSAHKLVTERHSESIDRSDGVLGTRHLCYDPDLYPVVIRSLKLTRKTKSPFPGWKRAF
jgi:hypothetical protein